MRGNSRVDVVVVGAGAAGLGASRTGRALGLDVLTLEAMNRIGGRAHTTSVPFGFPWDAGCHWLHSASINLFMRFADELGFRYRSESTPWRLWANGRLSSAQTEREIGAYIDGSLTTVMQCGEQGVDVPVAEVVDRDSQWFDMLRFQINAEWGVDPRATSTLDVFHYRDTGENWPVEDGYGALVAAVAGSAAADVELNSPVETIDWSGTGVRVSGPFGTVDADAAIVTASTGVLSDNLIAFDPALPAWKLEAIGAAPLGRANKIAIQLAPIALEGVPEESVNVPIAAEQMMSLRLRPYGRNLVDCYVGGPACAELEAAGEAAMIDTALAAIEKLLGSEVRRSVAATAVSMWASEPYIRGAYAAALPGQADRRPDLRRPLGDRVFFAGEASSPDFFTTCHGAWLTGEAAMHDANAMITRKKGRQGQIVR